MGGTRTLHVVFRQPTGRIGHQAIGSAVVEADYEAKLTKLALRRGIESLADFSFYSPAQAAEAMRELDELGDVDFSANDFEPRFFDPQRGLDAVDGLLKHGRAFTTALREDLVFLRDVLGEATRRGCQFYLVEPEPEEPMPFENLLLAERGRGRAG